MSKYELANQLMFKKDWVWDPPDIMFKHFEVKDLTRLAVVQLKAQHAVLKAQEELIEETLEIYSGYLK